MSMINIYFVACILVFAPYVYIELPEGGSILKQWDLVSLHIQELWQKISEAYDQYWLCCLHFTIVKFRGSHGT